MTSKLDKLPTLDPCQRGIFDVIVATAASERQRRKSNEYRQAEERREAAAKSLRDLKAFEARKAADDRAREEAVKLPVFTPGRPLLSLR